MQVLSGPDPLLGIRGAQHDESDIRDIVCLQILCLITVRTHGKNPVAVLRYLRDEVWHDDRYIADNHDPRFFHIITPSFLSCTRFRYPDSMMACN